jgi:hypothetical protein
MHWSAAFWGAATGRGSIAAILAPVPQASSVCRPLGAQVFQYPPRDPPSSKVIRVHGFLGHQTLGLVAAKLVQLGNVGSDECPPPSCRSAP